MPSYAAVSRQKHGTRRWLRFPSFAFANAVSQLPLVASELPRVVPLAPIAFRRDGGGIMPVVVLGLQPGQNLFVAPDGRWIGSYVPSALRGHPFRLLKAGQNRLALCVDEESGLLAEGTQGEAFFAANGELAPALQQVLTFLSAVQRDQEATARACAALLPHRILAPWPSAPAGASPWQSEGLFQVDVTALNQLSPAAFDALRQAGALPILYSQIFSMQHLPLLQRLEVAKVKAVQERQSALAGILDGDAPQDLQIDWDAFGQNAGDNPA